MPPLASLGCLAAALVLAIMRGFATGSLLAVLVCVIGVALGAHGVWQGMQKESQKPMALALLGLIGNLGLGAVLLVLKLVHSL
jgi:hypothetical protein